MSIHDYDIKKSIDLNIIGTSNIVKICSDNDLKLIFFSTSYVYPGNKGNYKESDPILPWNNYGWSKAGAEAAVQMYKKSLIIRACMTEKPFLHKHAYSNVKSNFIFHDKFIRFFLKTINKKGIINIGGKTSSVYKFVKKTNKKVKKIYIKNNDFPKMPKNSSMNLKKLRKIIGSL